MKVKASKKSIPQILLVLPVVAFVVSVLLGAAFILLEPHAQEGSFFIIYHSIVLKVVIGINTIVFAIVTAAAIYYKGNNRPLISGAALLLSLIPIGFISRFVFALFSLFM